TRINRMDFSRFRDPFPSENLVPVGGYNVLDGNTMLDQMYMRVEHGPGTGRNWRDMEKENILPSYGKKSVPIGPYLEINGFPVKIKPGAQEKHIPNTPNYKQEIANRKNKSIFYGDNKIAQELLEEYAGKGTTVTKNKERVDFDQPIGKYYDRDTDKYLETTKGIIHYSKNGAHIVPSRP